MKTGIKILIGAAGTLGLSIAGTAVYILGMKDGYKARVIEQSAKSIPNINKEEREEHIREQVGDLRYTILQRIRSIALDELAEMAEDNENKRKDEDE